MPKKASGLKYYQATGRRKSAVARVRLYIAGRKEINVFGAKIKKGEIYVNKKKIGDYFPEKVEKNKYLLPFKLTNTLDRFAVSIQVKGGGKKGQLEAIILGISRALVLVDKDFKPLLKKEKLLTRDARVKERRKVGTGGKARRKKQSPKR